MKKSLSLIAGLMLSAWVGAAEPARTLYEEPAGVFFENLVSVGGGRVAVTSFLDGRVLEVDAAGRARLIAQLPGFASGIESLPDGSLLVAGWHRDERRLLWRIAPDGRAAEWLPLPGVVMPNGLTTLQPGVLLLADSIKGRIWRVEVATKAVSVWSDDAQLGGFDPASKPAIPAVNGLKRHGDWLYASNMSLKRIVRLPVAADSSAGPAQAFAEVFADDFAIAADGTVYASTHVGNSVVRISADGKIVQQIAGRAQGLQGATAVALDGEHLLVTTNGGVYVPPAWGLEAARLVRLPR